MSRCSQKKGIWVVKQCENAAFTLCAVCKTPFCTEHLTISADKRYLCLQCMQEVGSIPPYAVEDFYSGEIENYLYFLSSLSQRFRSLQENNTPIPIEKLYNFTKYDALSFRQEFVQYYDDNDTSANLYDS